MRLMSEVMAHTLRCTCSTRRAASPASAQASGPARPHPQEELASYLNLTPETLSRLRQRAA